MLTVTRTMPWHTDLIARLSVTLCSHHAITWPSQSGGSTLVVHRVAQNKMSHGQKCNFMKTGGFSTTISGFKLKNLSPINPEIWVKNVNQISKNTGCPVTHFTVQAKFTQSRINAINITETMCRPVLMLNWLAATHCGTERPVNRERPMMKRLRLELMSQCCRLDKPTAAIIPSKHMQTDTHSCWHTSKL